MADKEYVPRLNVEIRADQLEALQQFLDHGLRKALFQVIIDDLISWLRLDRGFTIGALLNRQIGLKELSELRKGD